MFPIRDTIPSRTYPFITVTLIVANSFIFIFEITLPEPQLKNLFYLFGLVPARFHEVINIWPFITSMFLHGGWMHLLSNMWSLWIFGDNVEDKMGHIGFFIFYLFCGAAAAIVHYLTNLHSVIPTVGASGAIAGVMGAYFFLFPMSRVVTMVPIFFYPVFVEIPAVFYLGLWFYTQFLSGMASLGTGNVGGIAWWAHIGGFATGGILMPLFVRRRRYWTKT